MQDLGGREAGCITKVRKIGGGPFGTAVFSLWIVEAQSGRVKQLVRYSAMSPRGNQIVYEYTETPGNIWMFEFK